MKRLLLEGLARWLVPPGEGRQALGARGGRIEVDGVSLAYDDRGVGPPVVCLHALGHGATDYADFAARISDRHRVIALDWPGQGASGEGPPPDARAYARLCAGFLDALAIERPILVGNSIGGAAALELAAAEPGRPRGLVLVNPGGLFLRSPLAAAATGGMARFFGAGARGAAWFPAAFAAYYRLVLSGRPAAAQRRRIVAAGRELAPLLAAGWRRFGEADADLRARAEQVACPVLVAWATRDRFNPLWLNRPAIKRLRRAELRTFPAGHSPFLETPERFAAAFLDFAARLPD